MIKAIGKYLGIGVLLGIGISAVDWIYFEMTWEAKQKKSVQAVDELKMSLDKFKEKFFVPGYEGLWEALENSKPEALLNFNLARAKVHDSGVQITGTITNLGPALWNGLVVEVEALDKHSRIFAECNEILQVLEPGQAEAVVMECPFTKDVKDPDLSEMSFRIIRKFVARAVEAPVPTHNKALNN